MKLKIKIPYLFTKIKLNYNCPDSEKTGEGPGSCSKNTDHSLSIKDMDHNLKNWESEIRSKLTSDEMTVIDNWGKKYELINSYLYYPPRNKEIMKDQFKDIQLMDNIMNKNETPTSMKVYRGIPFLNRMPKSILQVGSEISLKGFTPTSTSEIWAKIFQSPEGALLEISVPKGTKAIYMHENKNMQMTERELLLNRDLKYRVMSVERQSNNLSFKYKIKMEIIK